MLDQVLATKPARPKSMGKCTKCTCLHYVREVEPLSAADCLADVERRIDRGADGGSVEKKTVGAEVCHFALGEREVVMCVAGPFC